MAEKKQVYDTRVLSRINFIFLWGEDEFGKCYTVSIEGLGACPPREILKFEASEWLALL